MPASVRGLLVSTLQARAAFLRPQNPEAHLLRHDTRRRAREHAGMCHDGSVHAPGTWRIVRFSRS